ncbi:hypothetical protein C9426_09915 [Serratia sp. S1B]|nr:hypothetical protein C9426_09915 [Serratia sp. S1B]
MSNEKTNSIITLTVGGNELKFAPTLQAYNKCLNEAARAEDLVGAIATYLKRIVVPESREALAELLLVPGLGSQIAEKINKVFAPSVEIEVKE